MDYVIVIHAPAALPRIIIMADSDNDPFDDWPYSDYDCLYKLAIIGDADTGKSTLLARFAGDVFNPGYIPTIGVDFRSHRVTLDDSITELQIWDTAGEPRFRIVTQSFYRGVQAFIVVYDATKQSSFENVSYWIAEARKQNQEAKIFLVGNKCDSGEKAVDYETARDFAQKNAVLFLEVSAMDGTNVELAFLTVAAQVEQSYR